MGSFYDALADIAEQAGRGLQRGMENEFEFRRNVAQQQRGFQALRPLRQAQAAEKEEFEAPERERTFNVLEPVLRQRGVLPPVPERGEAAVTPESYRRVKPEVLFKLLETTKPTARTGRAVTQVEMQAAYSDPNNPLHEEAKLYFEGPPGEVKPDLGYGPKGYIGTQAAVAGGRTGANIDVTRAKPPIPPTSAIKEFADTEALLEQGYRASERFKKDYAGLIGGRVRGRMMARIFGPTEEEANFRAAANAFRANLRRQLSGLAVTAPELQENVEAIPDPERVSPQMFMSALDENLMDIEAKLERRRAGYARPRGAPAGPAPQRPRAAAPTRPGTVVKDYGGGFVLRERSQ